MQVVEPLVGTRAEIEASADDPSVVGAVEAATLSEVGRLEAIFSVFQPDSAIHQLRGSGHTTVAELEAVVDLALDWHRRTDGAFHPSLQPLIDIWREAEATQTMPADRLLAEVVAQLRSPSLATLDLNALGKGWIGQRAVEVGLAAAATEGREVDGVWLSLGGDIVHRGHGAMTVGVEDPHRPYDNVAPMLTVELRNEAMATSGAARRWWTIGGTRYAKVLDPRTGWPVDHVASATVIAADAADADALATAALVLDPDQTIELAGAEGGEVLLVLADRSRVASGRLRPG
ncbi:MAG: FAD:protein FMN transferase [Actinomycetota bacterium]